MYIEIVTLKLCCPSLHLEAHQKNEGRYFCCLEEAIALVLPGLSGTSNFCVSEFIMFLHLSMRIHPTHESSKPPVAQTNRCFLLFSVASLRVTPRTKEPFERWPHSTALPTKTTIGEGVPTSGRRGRAKMQMRLYDVKISTLSTLSTNIYNVSTRNDPFT